MSVVAPICGVSAIAAPVVFGVWLGERPSGMAWLGVALAVAAVVLCGQERRVPLREREAKSGLQKPAALAVMAGLMIGFFYICLQRTSHAAGMWPVLAARTVSAFLVTLMAFGAKQSLRLPSAARWLVVGAGIVDTSANMAFQGAVRLGDLSIVATIASLYPAATIILARTVLKERFSGVQIAGMAVAVVSVILISTG
jgi:uncharacterized membrane protein